MTDQILIAHELPAVRRLISAARNEAVAFDAQQNAGMAALLRADADRLERRMFAQRAIAWKPGPLDVRMDSDV